ncbi:hypothetical protein FGO68_gene12250 [Halteria grandinella]|uniref:Uncharacterized protein n=1 Tax=Halteria grandinella TaxID=5974 RepID=A0A8J8SYH8_HALGN|nr:hypothetical protein FGO68_gene12250 [Halteria grandinella]
MNSLKYSYKQKKYQKIKQKAAKNKFQNIINKENQFSINLMYYLNYFQCIRDSERVNQYGIREGSLLNIELIEGFNFPAQNVQVIFQLEDQKQEIKQFNGPSPKWNAHLSLYLLSNQVKYKQDSKNYNYFSTLSITPINHNYLEQSLYNYPNQLISRKLKIDTSYLIRVGEKLKLPYTSNNSGCLVKRNFSVNKLNRGMNPSKLLKMIQSTMRGTQQSFMNHFPPISNRLRIVKKICKSIDNLSILLS